MAQQIGLMQQEIARLGQEMADRDRRLDDASTAQADLVRKLDELALLNAEISERLEKAGQSVSQLATERGSLAAALEDTRKKLEELRKQQAAAEARAAQFRELLLAFRKMIDSGKLDVTIREGRMLVELKNDILFDSGKTAIKTDGKATLREVAKVLATLPNRRFQVAGHTDNVKIQTAKFPSNWELSTARAVEVVRFLIESGMRSESLSAAGYGEFSPAAPNDTDEGRGKNRRIEIALVPDLDEMIKIPEERRTLPDARNGAPDAPDARGAPSEPTTEELAERDLARQ